jgi:hypothetical protein
MRIVHQSITLRTGITVLLLSRQCTTNYPTNTLVGIISDPIWYLYVTTDGERKRTPIRYREEGTLSWLGIRRLVGLILHLNERGCVPYVLVDCICTVVVAAYCITKAIAVK